MTRAEFIQIISAHTTMTKDDLEQLKTEDLEKYGLKLITALVNNE